MHCRTGETVSWKPGESLPSLPSEQRGFGEAIGELRNGICTVQAVVSWAHKVGSVKWKAIGPA